MNLWKQYDYLSSLFHAKYDYQKTELFEELKLDEENSVFIMLLMLSSVSSIVFLLEIVVFCFNVRKNYN